MSIILHHNHNIYNNTKIFNTTWTAYINITAHNFYD